MVSSGPFCYTDLMKSRLIFYLLLIFALSFIANWGIQLSYYYFTIAQNPLAFNGLKTLMNYQTGVIGDALLLPIMNDLMFYCLFSLKLNFKKLPLLKIAIISLSVDLLIHALQGTLEITNWSMPKPFQWNLVSYWHMISLFFQLLLIFLFFYSVFRYSREIEAKRRINNTALVALVLFLIFLVLFIHDYSWLFGIGI